MSIPIRSAIDIEECSLDAIKERLHPTDASYTAEPLSIEQARWLLAWYEATQENWNECLRRMQQAVTDLGVAPLDESDHAAPVR